MEILRRDALWDLIRYVPNLGFLAYRNSIVQEDVIEHLDLMIENLKRFRNYDLILTEAHFPFTLVSFAVHSSAIPEYFTLLYQHYSRENLYDVSAFIVSDCHVHQGVSARVIDWVLKHPTTVRERGAVLEELGQIRDHLVTHGPLPQDMPIPRVVNRVGYAIIS